MNRFFALLVLLLWSVSLADAAVAAVRVWCVGADGHAGIEYATGINCADAPEIRAQCAQPLVVQSHCGPCVDAVLASDQAAIPMATVVPAPAGKIVIPVPVALLPLADDGGSQGWIFVGGEQPPPSQQLLEHRSVVLLI